MTDQFDTPFSEADENFFRLIFDHTKRNPFNTTLEKDPDDLIYYLMDNVFGFDSSFGEPKKTQIQMPDGTIATNYMGKSDEFGSVKWLTLHGNEVMEVEFYTRDAIPAQNDYLITTGDRSIRIVTPTYSEEIDEPEDSRSITIYNPTDKTSKILTTDIKQKHLIELTIMDYKHIDVRADEPEQFYNPLYLAGHDKPLLLTDKPKTQYEKDILKDVQEILETYKKLSQNTQILQIHKLFTSDKPTNLGQNKKTPQKPHEDENTKQ